MGTIRQRDRMLNRTRIKRKAAVALAKLGRFTTDEALPLANRSVTRARGAADEAMLRLLGSDFEERVRRINVKASLGGTDPFGFDLQTAKYAAAAAAFFHRVYFRSEVFGIE